MTYLSNRTPADRLVSAPLSMLSSASPRCGF